jgi:hypothetical protein
MYNRRHMISAFPSFGKNVSVIKFYRLIDLSESVIYVVEYVLFVAQLSNSLMQ